MRKINVKGTSGSGKSTFARELAERLALPYVELDGLYHGPGWSAPTPTEFRATVEPYVRGDVWVIDGNYETQLGRLVLDAADTVVWLDLPLRVKLGRLWRRTVRRIRMEEELWGGNRESWRGAFWGVESLFVWTLRSHVRHKVTFPRSLPRDRLVRLRSERDAREWLEQVAPRRKRVIAYATRARNGRKELLVFDLPEQPGTPTQVPAGRLDAGESLAQGLERELYEETGLRLRRIVRELAPPQELEDDRRPGVRGYENYAFEVEVEDETRDEWDHVCVGDGDDAGYVFRCRWVPLEPDLVLWQSGTDSVLPRLLD